MVSTRLRIAMIGSGLLAQRLSEHFRGEGHEVAIYVSASVIGAQADLPLDLAVLADNDLMAPRPLAEVTRADLAAAMHRLAYEPFAVASALRPGLAAGKGRIVLLTSATARMDFVDTEGAYLERPFRAAAHALWRCLSVEWKADGISCGLVAADSGEFVLEQLARTIVGPSHAMALVELQDAAGTRLGW